MFNIIKLNEKDNIGIAPMDIPADVDLNLGIKTINNIPYGHKISLTNIKKGEFIFKYGQKIGIMSAITEGIADRIKTYLDKALKIDDSDTLANLSKGLWHAEIINQVGKTLAKAVYGANSKKARKHFSKAYDTSESEISILYELSYGYYLLGEDEDIVLAKKYLSRR